MHLNFWKTFRVCLLLAIGAAIGVGVLLTYQYFKGPQQTVNVTGTGQAQAVADQVTLNIQVTYAKDAKSLKDALVKLGIPESRITQSSSPGPVGVEVPPAPTTSTDIMHPLPTPIQITTINFTVVLDSLKNVENVFAAINANPNTQINSTSYSVDNTKGWELKAKEAALNDARAQVEAVAKINHLKVGKLISLSDTSSQPIVQPMSYAGQSPTTDQITSGKASYSKQTVTITASYNATYEVY